MVKKSIVEKVKKYLLIVRKNGFSVSFGVIFGSQSTGSAGKWSDIDLIVVSPLFDKKRSRKDIDLLWRLATLVDSRIEPVPCGKDQWKKDDGSAIIEIARRQGEKVLP